MQARPFDPPRSGTALPLPRGGRDVAIVVAHPDDETIGLGGQLARLPGALIVHVTDGAPVDTARAPNGEYAREAYAASRRAELKTAMALANVSPDRLVTFNIVDQTAIFHAAAIARRLMAWARERAVTTILTHPYEGGHPDHDATCLTVHAAAALLMRMHATRLDVAEMAFYSERGGRFIARRFVDEPTDGSTELRLGDDDWSRKRRMLAAFASQRSILETFGGRIERLRPAPTYDFARLPNGGELHYARFIANPTGDDFLAAARAALRELDLPSQL